MKIENGCHTSAAAVSFCSRAEKLRHSGHSGDFGRSGFAGSGLLGLGEIEQEIASQHKQDEPEQPIGCDFADFTSSSQLLKPSLWFLV